MLFTYTYRSSDGARHTAEIEAESRDAAFAKVRTEMGIKPIKVVASSRAGELASSDERSRSKASSSHTRTLANSLTAIAAIAVIAGGAWWLLAGRGGRGDEPPADLPAGKLESPPTRQLEDASAARPRPRAQIEGFDGIDLERAFPRAADRFLARYAQPGERPPADGAPLQDGLAEEIIGSLKAPVPLVDGDADNVRRLKGAVAGIKADILLLLASGQTIGDVLAWLENRQGMEAAYRDRIVSGLKTRPSSKGEVNHLLRTLGLREVE